jgi:thiol:disulfide interchange protein
MRKFLLAFFSGLFFLQTIGQTKELVHFSISSEIRNEKKVLSIKVQIEKGVQLMPVLKITDDNPFQTKILFDSTSRNFLKSDIQQNAEIKNAVDETSNLAYTYISDSAEWIQELNISSNETIKGKIVWLAKNGNEFISGEVKISEEVKLQTTASDDSENSNKSILTIFLITFLTGLIAVITPCVFPLIPVTVSFFLKRSKSKTDGLKNAVWYSLCIILIYTIPTILLTLVFGDTILYKISTHAISNLLFFLIFIIFAISFFGAFELTLPNSWANKADQKAGKGGLGGIFFMALTLVIVSFSCTGPIVGTLLGQTSSQGVSIAPIIGMLGFGVGLALPFSLFAFFPSMLQSLPKSGGWLNTVKVTFGFIELALALKFLSNVDLIYHWQLLNRDVFLVLWIIIFGLMGLYLLGKLKFSHDSDLAFISIPRLFFAMASLSFALYMVPGLWGSPLKPLSGFIPPATSQSFNLDDLKYQIENIKTSNGTSSNTIKPVKYIDKLHVPFGLTAYFDLDEGMQAAKQLNKPVMLDFTGHSCANCRKMEEQVWKDENVLKRIKENFVLISLYVDESTELPVSEQYTNAKGEKIVTVGEKNLDYEITKFGFNAQPLYMFLDLQGNPLSNIKYGYDSDVKKFIQHLDLVVAEFKKR